MSELNINERSWAIELITEINLYLNNRDYFVTRATGEKTVTEANLFPDVILYGGSGKNILLQCWELKMPETGIHEDDPFQKAINKATLLGLNSFVVWNANIAELWKIENDGKVVFVKSYCIPEIKTREDVITYRDLWVNKLHEIIDDVNEFARVGAIKQQRPELTISNSLYDKFTSTYLGYTENEIKKAIQNDNLIEAQINRWWDLNSNNFHKTNKITTASIISIVRWINRFIYAHYLTSISDAAKVVFEIDEETTPAQALDIFQSLCEKIDHYAVFSVNEWDKYIGGATWSALIELNGFLQDLHVSALSAEALHIILEKIVNLSKRDVCGQYATPKPLAVLLASLTMKNKNGNTFDPCCGTGTIIKAAYDIKKQYGVSKYVETTWANDKFSQQLSICATNLTDPDNRDIPYRLINKDILDLSINDEITVYSPRNGTPSTIQFVPMDTIISNLPFVEFEKIRKENPKAAELPFPGRHDLYMRLAIYLKKYLAESGQIGLILSNSWLSVNNSIFWDELLKTYVIKYIIESNNGRWFKGVKVITTMIIGEKRNTSKNNNEIVNFITTKKHIENWDEITIRI